MHISSAPFSDNTENIITKSMKTFLVSLNFFVIKSFMFIRKAQHGFLAGNL